MAAKSKFIKTMTVLLGLAALALFTQFFPYWIRNPFKITNPESAHFNPDKFQFIDYLSEDSLKAALRKTLPPGTPKDVAERRLMKRNNTESYLVDYRPNFIGHCWNPKFSVIRLGACTHVVGVYYDDKNKVAQVDFKGKLFPENKEDTDANP